MKRDAFVFFTLAALAAAAGFGDVPETVSEVAQILSLVFLSLAVIALFIVKPLPE